MYIVFDIGGTKMRLAGSTDLVSFTNTKTVLTPKDFTTGVEMLSQMAQELAGGEKIKALAGGLAGPVDKQTGQLLTATNLPDWVGQSLEKILVEKFAVPTFISNDTAMAGLGEVHHGAGRGKNIVGYITVSTGIGGVRIVDGKIDEMAIGFEPGHQIIDYKVLTGELGSHHGHLDSLVSGQAVQNRFGRPAYEVTDEKIWQEISTILAVGLYNTVLHWSPELLILGGSMMKSPGIQLETVQTELGKLLQVFPTQPDIKLAELGDQGGLYGGLVLLREKLNL